MKKEILERWIAALRSGEYKQGRQQLYNGDGYCCLGVLCELAVKDGAIRAYDKEKETLLPMFLKEWAGVDPLVEDISQSSETFGLSLTVQPEGQHYQSLAALNDKGASFEQIADWLEKYGVRDTSGGVGL